MNTTTNKPTTADVQTLNQKTQAVFEAKSVVAMFVGHMEGLLGQFKGIAAEAVKRVQTEKLSALTDVRTEKTKALTEINVAKSKTLNETNAAKSKVLAEVNATKSKALGEVNVAKSKALAEINAAKAKALAEINAAKASGSLGTADSQTLNRPPGWSNSGSGPS